MRSERNIDRRRYWPLWIFLLLGTLAGAYHNHAVAHGRTDVVAGTIRTAIAPPATVLGRLSRWASDQTGWLFHGRVLATENRNLKIRVQELERENGALQEAANAGIRLQNDLGFVHRQAQAPLPAEVIARRPDARFDTILISRGSMDGVHPHSVVVTRNGLVGQVGDVSPTTASVILLTDQNGGAGAIVQRAKSRVMGICKGDYSDLIPLIDLPNDADVQIGDLIVTSGFGVFPKGIPIGHVVSIKLDDGNITKTARLRPVVDFDRLEEVYVLR